MDAYGEPVFIHRLHALAPGIERTVVHTRIVPYMEHAGGGYVSYHAPMLTPDKAVILYFNHHLGGGAPAVPEVLELKTIADALKKAHEGG